MKSVAALAAMACAGPARTAIIQPPIRTPMEAMSAIADGMNARTGRACLSSCEM